MFVPSVMSKHEIGYCTA